MFYNPALPRMGSGSYNDDFEVKFTEERSGYVEVMRLTELLYKIGPLPRETEANIRNAVIAGDPMITDRLCNELDQRYKATIIKQRPVINYVPIEAHNLPSFHETVAKEMSMSSRDRDIYYLTS